MSVKIENRDCFLNRSKVRQMSDWNTLERAILNNAQIRNSDRSIILNRRGEIVTEPPEQIAEFIKAGGIYIDWCGAAFWTKALVNVCIPFPEVLNQTYLPLGSGIGRFLRSLGIIASGPDGREHPLWEPPFHYGISFPFHRSLVVSNPLHNLTNFRPLAQAPQRNGPPLWIYGGFAVTSGIPGSGVYLYAYGEGDTGIGPDVYIPQVLGWIQWAASKPLPPPPSPPPPPPGGEPPPPGGGNGGTQPPQPPVGGDKRWWERLDPGVKAAIIIGGATVVIGGAIMLTRKGE